MNTTNTTSKISSPYEQFIKSHYSQLCESLELHGMESEAERIRLAKEMDFPIDQLFLDALLRLAQQLLIEHVAQPLRDGPKPRVQANLESEEHDLCCSDDGWREAELPELMGMKTLKSLKSFVSTPEIQRKLFLKPDLACKVGIYRLPRQAELEERLYGRDNSAFLLAPAKERTVVGDVFLEPLRLPENIFCITVTY